MLATGFASALHAEDHDEVLSACRSFLFFDVLNDLSVDFRSNLEFENVQIWPHGPERYTNISASVRFAAGTPDGSPLANSPTVIANEYSIQIECLADTVDRRVLTISVGPGYDVGQLVPENSPAYPRLVLGLTEETVEIGSKVHEGKY